MGKSGRCEPGREFRSSTKMNSDFKWKVDRSVVGALEIETDPVVDLTAEMRLHDIPGCEAEFKEYFKVWKDLKLKDEFIQAYETLPPETVCCGVITNQDKTIRKNVHALNEGWIKSVNARLAVKGFKLSVFVWQWTNMTGKAETVIPMIRFHELSTTLKKKKDEREED